MSKRFDKRLLLVRANDATDFEAADALLAANFELTPLAGDTVTREMDRAHYGRRPSIAINKHQTLAFDVEFAAGANAGVAQPWALPLMACGFAQVLTVADPANSVAARTDYNPVTGGETQCKMAFNWDGIRHLLTNVLGTMSLNLQSNQIPKFRFAMTGLFAAPGDAVPLAGDYSAFQEPHVADNAGTPTVSLFGLADIPLESFSLDMATVVRHKSRVNIASDTIITGREPSGTLVVEAQAAAEFNPVSRADEGTEGVVEIVHGAAGGRQLTVRLPKCRIGQGVQYQDSENELMHSIPLEILPTDGNDEIKISVT